MERAEEDIKKIFVRANQELEGHPLIGDTKSSLQTTTKEIAGSDHSPSAIKAADVEFEKILRTLHVQMEGSPIGSLTANGLGYNNLLYIAVVLEHLKSPDSDEWPMFLVEEPEAHLHPQLTMLLADYLAHKTPGEKIPQTIVTTHSPTLAASVPPNRIHLLFLDQMSGKARAAVSKTQAWTRERGDLQRMMDVTRATLYFAKGALLVEGVSEAMLLPALAKRLGYNLAKLHISVIPICGVAFNTFKKLLDPATLGIPVSIVTDADPPVTRGASWNEDTPVTEGSSFKLSDRSRKLVEIFLAIKRCRSFTRRLRLNMILPRLVMKTPQVWQRFGRNASMVSREPSIVRGSLSLVSIAMLRQWRRGVASAEQDTQGARPSSHSVLRRRLLKRTKMTNGF